MGSADAPVETGSSSEQGAVGRAFSVEDGLLALRWADAVRSQGYRLTFSHAFVEAEEALEIWHAPRRRAVATIIRGVRWVWLIDGAGVIAHHRDLAAALCSVCALTSEQRQMIESAETSSWLWHGRPEPSVGKRGIVARLRIILARLPAVWRRAA